MLLSFFANFLVAAACLGAGYPLLHLLPPSLARAEKLVYSWLGGFGVLGLVLFLVGQFSFRRSTVFVIVFAFAALAVYRLISNRTILVSFSWPVPGGATLPLLVLAFVLFVTFLAGFAPPAGDWDNDAIAYHLLGPKVWLRDALIRPVPDNCHTAFPATAEVIFAALMSFGGDSAPNLSAFWTFGLFLCVVYFLARRFALSPVHSLWVVALVASMPAVYAGAHSAFIDVIYASFLLASARILLDSDASSHGAAAGIFCGFAVATKYTGLLVFPFLLVSAWGAAAGRMQTLAWRPLTNKLAAFCLLTLLFGAPFYLRNWIVLGSPIYPPPPGLAAYFPVRYLSPAAIHSFHHYILVRGAGMGKNLTAFLLLPFNLTFHTANFHGAGGIGLAPLAFAPFAFRPLRCDFFARGFALLVALLTVSWFLTQQESRFLIPVYAVAAIFSVCGWEFLRQFPSRLARMLSALIIAISLGYGVLMIVRARRDDLHAAFSPHYAAQRNMTGVPYLSAFDFLNNDPSVRKVLILDRSVAPFYSEKPYVKVVGQWGEFPLPGVSSASQALELLPQLRITHILDIQSSLADFQVPIGDSRFILVFSQLHSRVYRVK
jgi:hypothetical protein